MLQMERNRQSERKQRESCDSDHFLVKKEQDKNDKRPYKPRKHKCSENSSQKQGSMKGDQRMKQSMDTTQRDDSYLTSARPLTERELDEIAESDDNEAINTTCLKLKGYQELLDEKCQIDKHHVMNNVLVILEKAISIINKNVTAKTGSDTQRANQVIGETLSFTHDKFQLALKLYIKNLWHNITLKQKEKICSLFCSLLSAFPSDSWEVLPVLELKEIAKLENETSIQQLVGNMVSFYEQEKEDKVECTEIPSHNVDNTKYKNLPIIPTWTEISSSKTPNHLRANISKGSYDDWSHYFDIQFRLLREDFVAPLRKGVQNYFKGVRGRQLSDVRVYTNIKILGTKSSHVGVCLKVNIGAAPRSSKQLIHGSLVCLSHDGFKENIFFATVESRESINRGMLDLHIHNAPIANLLKHVTKPFVMVESCAYFEAYSHILNSLQKCNALSMPFTNYLIDVNCQHIDMPLYLSENPDAFFDLSHLLKTAGEIDKNKKIRDQYSKVTDMCDITSWPSTDLTGFDASQLHALINGLTQELSIIQGPPGTGKTYIGLKIVETLLKNEQNWNSKKLRCKSPILVMCYTNHALDQFLEGILKILRDQRKKKILLRIGSRTKSKEMEKLHIKEKRKEIKIPGHLKCAERQAFNQRKQLTLTIDEYKDKFQLSLGTIVPIQLLQPIVEADHEYFFFKGGDDPERKFLMWLLPTNVNIPSITKVSQRTYDVLDQVSKIDDEDDDDEDYDDEDYDEKYKSAQIDDQYHDIFNKMSGTHDVSEDKISEIDVASIIEERDEYISRGKLDKLMQYMSTVDPMKKNEVMEVTKVSYLSWDKRVKLYKYWLLKYRLYLLNKYSDIFIKYNKCCEEVRAAQKEIDRLVMETASVIGMTTTGAAKYHDILQKVKPRIIIVEEAAEVLESHIVSVLGGGTHHLILIGDHKQLRPKPNVYRLEKDYKLGISLFERLINNHHTHVTLTTQHRMRPEIAELVHPHIYDTLENHNSVEQYPNVRGVDSNLFFIDHDNLESEGTIDDCSHSNEHEVNYLAALCHYLLQQNYTPSQITVLVTYSGQLLKMRKKIKEDPSCQDVRVCTVDNFQGEENDIILLSLVRSNESNNVGFLKEENRVCVALSRAKHGLYCIGNFQLLRSVSLTWDHIVSDWEEKKIIDKGLLLKCNNHPEVTFVAKSSEDFMRNSPTGGCSQQCRFRLSACGHSCTRTCHTNDPEHKSIECMKKCDRTCERGHACNLKCYQECGPCSKLILQELPCGHELEIKCSTDPSQATCIAPCAKKCSNRDHPCSKQCFQSCGLCEVKVTVTMPECNHVVLLPCHVPLSHENCPKPCEKMLPCGHKCTLKCGQDCSTGKCAEPLSITLPCNHVQKLSCWEHVLGRHECKHACEKLLSCNHPCKKLCSEPCTEKCMVMVDKEYPCNHKRDFCYKPTCVTKCEEVLKCGHLCPNLCGEPCTDKCKVHCKEVLVCGHKCEGECYSCKSTGIHKLCKFIVNMKRFCGHELKVSCKGLSDNECNKITEISCSHKKVRQPCDQVLDWHCNRPCQWQCYHHKCYKQCSENCDRPQCDIPCNSLLGCGHRCHGLCGEPCMNICPECDRSMFDYFLRRNFHRGSKYYQLQCDHLFVVEDLDKYVQEHFDTPPYPVGPLCCPLKSCGTPMSTSYRYGNIVKLCLKRVQQVRNKIKSCFDSLTEQAYKVYASLRENNFICRNNLTQPNLIEPHKSEQLYLLSLLSRTVATSYNLNDSTCIAGIGLNEQIRHLCSLIYYDEVLSFTKVQGLERLYLRQCLQAQVHLAKQCCTASQTKSIKDADTFLQTLDSNPKSCIMKKELFSQYSKPLAREFPKTVHEGFYETMDPNHPVLLKGVWWLCTKDHYYCTPASMSNNISHHCPECKGEFYDFI